MSARILSVVGACLLAAVNVAAQGGIVFRNTPANPVLDGRSGLPVAADVAVAGLYYTVDLGAVPDPDQPTDGFLLAAVTPILAGGAYHGGTIPLVGLPAGTQVLLQVRGWSSAYASYAEALSDPLSQPLAGASTLMGPVMVGTQSIDLGLLVEGFTLTVVPEPSVLALGWLAMLVAAWRWRGGFRGLFPGRG